MQMVKGHLRGVIGIGGRVGDGGGGVVCRVEGSV